MILAHCVIQESGSRTQLVQAADTSKMNDLYSSKKCINQSVSLVITGWGRSYNIPEIKET